MDWLSQLFGQTRTPPWELSGPTPEDLDLFPGYGKQPGNPNASAQGLWVDPTTDYEKPTMLDQLLGLFGGDEEDSDLSAHASAGLKGNSPAQVPALTGFNVPENTRKPRERTPGYQHAYFSQMMGG